MQSPLHGCSQLSVHSHLVEDFSSLSLSLSQNVHLCRCGPLPCSVLTASTLTPASPYPPSMCGRVCVCVCVCVCIHICMYVCMSCVSLFAAPVCECARCRWDVILSPCAAGGNVACVCLSLVVPVFVGHHGLSALRFIQVPLQLLLCSCEGMILR